MDAFNAVCPEGKSVSSVDDLKAFTVADFKKILRAYKEKVSGCKADLLLRVYAIFCRLSPQSQSAEVTSSFQNQVINDPTYESVLKMECHNMAWSSDLRDMPNLSFLQLYDYLVVRTEKYDHAYIKSTSYKKLKAFQFYYEGFIKLMEIGTTPEFVYLHSKVKPSMKHGCYKVIVKFYRPSADVCAAACTCPALLPWKILNRKGLKEFHEPLACTLRLSKWNVPRNSSSDPAPIDSIVIKK